MMQQRVLLKYMHNISNQHTMAMSGHHSNDSWDYVTNAANKTDRVGVLDLYYLFLPL